MDPRDACLAGLYTSQHTYNAVECGSPLLLHVIMFFLNSEDMCFPESVSLYESTT